MSHDITVGTCGKCGGPMRQPSSLCYVGPYPSPKCAWCGFEFHGPVMRPQKSTILDQVGNEDGKAGENG